MDVNAIPKIDMADNPTGCCPRFHPESWDDQTFVFDKKKFVKANTVSIMHMPINMGRVFDRVQNHIAEQKAELPDGYLTMVDTAKNAGKIPGKVFFFYTICPKCAKIYGKNYVVGLVEI